MFASSPFRRGLLAGSLAFAVALGTHAGAQTPTTSAWPAPPQNRAELQKQLEKRFDALDTNKDGQISADERKAAMSARRAGVFAKADKDGNGAISRDEFDAMRQGRKGPDGHGAHRSGRHGKGPEMASKAAGQPETKAQFMQRRLAMFDRVDANKDGQISAEERAAMRGKIGPRKGQMTPPAPPPGG